ncbi:MAG TPA: nuclear transport factor 2 family protein [Holophagaceae bacterium]|nr:nuclear transport factor 2 family protein [Holophagaceae bacterium]
MSSNLLTRFYEAFARKDAEGMAACYHEGSAFSDPVFPMLNHDETCAMWRMLLGRAQDFSLTFEVTGEDQVAWVARYTFTQTGRSVVNRVKSQFGFQDGLILAQRDGFDLALWLKQALGWKGALFGRTRLLQAATRTRARKGLDAFMEKSRNRESREFHE